MAMNPQQGRLEVATVNNQLHMVKSVLDRASMDFQHLATFYQLMAESSSKQGFAAAAEKVPGFLQKIEELKVTIQEMSDASNEAAMEW